MTSSRAAQIESAFEANTDFATTLAKGMALLECFSAIRPVLSVAELAVDTGLKRPTVARLAYTLSELGYLARVDGGFRLAMRALTLIHPLLASLGVRQTARPLMQELASAVRGTVSIGVLDGCNLVYVETARSGDTGPHMPDIGSTVPLLRTALGRALVYMLPANERTLLEQRLAREMPDLWKTMRAALSTSLDSCKRRGFSVSRGDWVQQIYSVGAPLFHDPHFGYFAINCGVPAFRLHANELEDELGPRLSKLAATIRASCGSDWTAPSSVQPKAKSAKRAS